jgi:hypothetical protein
VMCICYYVLIAAAYGLPWCSLGLMPYACALAHVHSGIMVDGVVAMHIALQRCPIMKRMSMHGVCLCTFKVSKL